jgi:hypothetical protein
VSRGSPRPKAEECQGDPSPRDTKRPRVVTGLSKNGAVRFGGRGVFLLAAAYRLLGLRWLLKWRMVRSQRMRVLRWLLGAIAESTRRNYMFLRNLYETFRTDHDNPARSSETLQRFVGKYKPRFIQMIISNMKK